MALTPVAKQFLIELRINPLFQGLMKEINESRPVVPAYRPCQSQEETFSLLEQIKYESGRQQGFDLIFLLLTGDRA